MTYLVGVCPVLVFGTVGGIAEGLGAARELAGVGLFAGVRSQMCLQVFKSRISFAAVLELKIEKSM